MSRSASALVLALALVACGNGGPAKQPSACAPAPAPAPSGDPSWQTRIGKDQALVTRYQAEHRDTFAGIWLDDARQKIVMAFTDDPAAHLRRLRARADQPDLFDVVQHPASRSALVTEAESISKDKDKLKTRGITLTSVGVDDRSNRVTIGVAQRSTADAEYLCTVYGSDVIVRVEAVPSPRQS